MVSPSLWSGMTVLAVYTGVDLLYRGLWHLAELGFISRLILTAIARQIALLMAPIVAIHFLIPQHFSQAIEFLLAVLFTYLVCVSFLALTLVTRQRQWREWEQIPASEIRLSYEARENPPTAHRLPRCLRCNCYGEFLVIRRAHYFHCLRDAFIEEHELRADYAFADYMSACCLKLLLLCTRLGSFISVPLLIIFPIFVSASTSIGIDSSSWALFWILIGAAYFLSFIAFVARTLVRNLQRRLALHGLPRRHDFDLDDDDEKDLQELLIPSSPPPHRLLYCVLPCVYESSAFERLFPLSCPDLVACLLHVLFAFVCLYVPCYLSWLVRFDSDLLHPLPVALFLLPLLLLAYIFPSLIANYSLVRFIGPLVDLDVLNEKRALYRIR